jgi:uncharacterized membrane protein YkvA (DUF1232 family)
VPSGGDYGTSIFDRLRRFARLVKRDVVTLYLAARDPRVPWYAKAVAACVAAYALSPIDLIPDFIPVLGYLDDVIIVPLGIWLAVRLIPADVYAELRDKAGKAAARPTGRVGPIVIVAIWILVAAGAAWWGADILRDLFGTPLAGAGLVPSLAAA